MHVTPALLAAILTAATAAHAEPLDLKAAGKVMFSPKGVDVRMRDDTGLSEMDLKTLKIMFTQKAFEAQVAYYGAIAVSPGDGLVAAPTTMAKDMHTPQAAAAAALGECNSKKSAAASCVVVADVLPKRFKPQPVTVSQSATAEFRSFRKGDGHKALAVSDSTDDWAAATGPNANLVAISSCLQKAQPKGADHCTVVVEDK